MTTMMMMMIVDSQSQRENEYSVAASYFSLFCKAQSANPGVASDTAATPSNDDDGHDDDAAADPPKKSTANHGFTIASLEDHEDPKNVDFWMEDVWTASDEEAAQQTLERQLNKCAISVPLISSSARPSTRRRGDTQEMVDTEDTRAWNRFYSHHGTRFFKDRHYLEKAFPDEFSQPMTNNDSNRTPGAADDGGGKTLVEIGCGVGNAILPLLEAASSPSGKWRAIHGLDISDEAIQLLRRDPRFVAYNQRRRDQERKPDDGAEDSDSAPVACSPPSSSSTSPTAPAVFGHVCDIARTVPSSCVGISDVTTLLFCLSAIDPAAMPMAAKHVASTLRPGGRLVVRDYGRYDEAQMKLGSSRGKRLKDNFYRKHDGTKCYYFTLQDLADLFCGVEVGLEVIELKFLRRVYENKAMGQKRRRVWVEGRFRKPHTQDSNAVLNASRV